MASENVYIALIINRNNDNLLSYNAVLALFNETYQNNTLIIEQYLTDSSVSETNIALDTFINKYPTGKRVSVSTTTAIVIECSKYFIRNSLNILNLSLTATANILQQENNILTYAPFNKYAVMNNFFIYKDFQMKYIHVLYHQNSTNGLFYNDYLEQINIQSQLLNIPLEISFLQPADINYNIKEYSMVIILADTFNLNSQYITPSFIQNFPNKSFILCTDYNGNMNDIFGNIPSVVQTTKNINFTTLSQKVYKSVKNITGNLKSDIYALYDILFVLKDFTTNGLEITKENYTTVNPYGSNPPAWILNTDLDPTINGSPYGKYQYTFTKDVIVGNDKTLFLKYYDGGQTKLPDSYSIFKISGITPNNPSLIEYDDAEYYKIYDKNCNLVAVKFNSDIVNFPLDKNLNIGKTCLTRFIYKFNSEGYFSKLERLLPYDGILPLVNSTMSKKIKKIVYK
jgi:hypothetical protein